MKKIPTSIIGAAGEHYVLSQLLRRGWIAALVPAGAPDMDILVTDKDGRKQCAVQVKTRRGKIGFGNWPMRKKHEEPIANLFYVFVDFGESPSDAPVCYILRSQVIADVLRLSHSLWLKILGRNDRRRNDSLGRRMCHDYSSLKAKTKQKTEKETEEEKDFVNRHGSGWMKEHRDAWDILGEPAS